MIVAAGLTPAWQQMLRFASVQTGDVNRAQEAHWTASGKVTNVGLALHFLGARSKTVGLCGGATGRAIEDEFMELGASAEWVKTACRTRVCTTILDASTGETTELVENASPVTADELAAFMKAYRNAATQAQLVVLSGSLPGGVPTRIYGELMDETPPRARVIIDARGPELTEALARRPFLVKPNRAELARTVGRELSGEDELRGAIAELHSRGAENVVVSDGDRATWLSDGESTWTLGSLATEVVNVIGCGDCMAAGIAWALAEGLDLVESVRRGIAAAAENAAALLPSRLDPDRVAGRAREVPVTAVK